MPLVTNIDFRIQQNFNVQMESAEDGFIVRGPDANGERKTWLFKEGEADFPGNAEAALQDLIGNAETLAQAEFEAQMNRIAEAKTQASQELADHVRKNDIVNGDTV